MSNSAIAPGPATLSGVMRIALFEEALADARSSFAAWPGERVETDALLMPASAPSVPAPVTAEAFVGMPAKAGSELLDSASALGAALLAVVVLTAGSGVVTSIVALALFR